MFKTKPVEGLRVLSFVMPPVLKKVTVYITISFFNSPSRRGEGYISFTLRHPSVQPSVCPSVTFYSTVRVSATLPTTFKVMFEICSKVSV